MVEVLRADPRNSDIPILAECDQGLVAAALSRPGATFGGAELHPGTAHKAALYIHSFSETQPCANGNKRIGTALALAYLKLNGLELAADPDDLADIVLAMADKSLGGADVALATLGDWLQERLQPRE